MKFFLKKILQHILGWVLLLNLAVAETGNTQNSGPILEISGPELFWDEAEAVPVVEVQEPDSISDSPDAISELLAAERQRASHFLKRLEVENSFVARLAVKLPIAVEETTEDITEPVTEEQENNSQSGDMVAEKIKQREKPVNEVADVDRLPLSDLTADSSLMKRAKVSFDEETDTWLAVWKKPAVFHFGMILHPELLDQVQDGEKLHFESKGMQLALLRSDENKLLVEQSNGKQHELGAKRLEGLLRRSITVDGLDLFLDAGGNLVLRAAGEKARSLASRLGSS
ncbi:MAG: hypothetical protein AAF571_05740 [Verrucomicrobiota bacterium]